MHTLARMASTLNRSQVEISGLQRRFELPLFPGDGYSDAYLAFLRTLVRLRTLQVPEDILVEMWTLEKKLLRILHVDSGGSPTWFLDACGRPGSSRRKLLLSQRELGASFEVEAVQSGLDLTPENSPELFPGEAMGEDALRLLRDYRRLHASVRKTVRASLAPVEATVAWGKRKFQR